jgi:4-diphosphocytidyl-2-C-methyl-D-erythritol kinase
VIKKAVYLERAPAKINLFLDILAKREDGFHDIDTVFQAIDLADHLTFSISMECTPSDMIEYDIKIDSNSEEVKALGLNNLVTDAIETYFMEVPEEQVVSLISAVKIDVFIDKNIPLEAGLAGGSANAAATLRALNQFFLENFDWSLNDKELLKLAARIGSDVPFCLLSNKNPRMRGSSRGELLSKEDSSKYQNYKNLIIVKPDFGVPTAEAYKLISKRLPSKHKPDHILFNRFEEVVYDKYPELLNIQEDLLSIGVDEVLLSGSGSSMLGFVSEQNNIKEIFSKAQKIFSDYEVFKASFLGVVD